MNVEVFVVKLGAKPVPVFMDFERALDFN